jgi:urea transporter
MSSSVVFFRALLLTSVGLGLIGSFIDTIFPSLIPQPLQTAFEALPDTPTPALVGAGALVVITFGGTIVAIAGLLFFQPWSRTLAVSMTALSLLFYPLLGVTIQSGWAQLFLDLSTTLWGVVLAMSYFSSLSTKFEPRRSS